MVGVAAAAGVGRVRPRRVGMGSTDRSSRRCRLPRPRRPAGSGESPSARTGAPGFTWRPPRQIDCIDDPGSPGRLAIMLSALRPHPQAHPTVWWSFPQESRQPGRARSRRRNTMPAWGCSGRAAPSVSRGGHMSEQRNVEALTKMYEAFVKGDLGYIVDQLADDVHWFSHVDPVVPTSGDWSGKSKVPGFFEAIIDSVEVASFTPTEFYADGETVISTGGFVGRPGWRGSSLTRPGLHLEVRRQQGRQLRTVPRLEAGGRVSVVRWRFSSAPSTSCGR